ncbi:hypothetical protein [Arthrobacter sp. CJ23]|uniref:hypothetical protein n=1 Tax=Arthrobacter sp. CJ23 TaxID=2972479 RepID=UPI00215B944B|nr:hypothetical protein [Arthrobacter sp. CJ23]UVJ37981.1 hypothetical protein NVV90_11960 [Arthrobacter sp. CJ23]
MITTADVIGFMGITQNLDSLELIVPAVNYYVDALPQIDRNVAGWESTTKFAAVLLAARWYKRRNSPGATIDGAMDGGQIRITKYDSDIARLLHIDGFEQPQVG